METPPSKRVRVGGGPRVWKEVDGCIVRAKGGKPETVTVWLDPDKWRETKTDDSKGCSVWSLGGAEDANEVATLAFGPSLFRGDAVVVGTQPVYDHLADVHTVATTGVTLPLLPTPGLKAPADGTRPIRVGDRDGTLMVPYEGARCKVTGKANSFCRNSHGFFECRGHTFEVVDTRRRGFGFVELTEHPFEHTPMYLSLDGATKMVRAFDVAGPNPPYENIDDYRAACPHIQPGRGFLNTEGGGNAAAILFLALFYGYERLDEASRISGCFGVGGNIDAWIEDPQNVLPGP